MGFKVTATSGDNQYGLNLVNTVITFHGNARIVKNKSTTYDEKTQEQVETINYIVQGKYSLYATQAIYTSNGIPVIQNKTYSTTVDTLTGIEPLTQLYDALKSNLNVSTSVLV